MKNILCFILVFVVAAQCLGQAEIEEKSEENDKRDECVVFFFDHEAEAGEVEEDEDLKKFEIGRFFTTTHEGTRTIKKFPQTESRLFVIVSVHFDDDLYYGEYLRDAMTINISVALNDGEEGPFLAFSSSHFEHNNYFGAANASLMLKHEGKDRVVHMECKKINPVSFDDEQ